MSNKFVLKQLMYSEKDIKLQQRRANGNSPQEDNPNSSNDLIKEREDQEKRPYFSNKQVPIMKVTKHKSTLLLGEDKKEEKKDGDKKEEKKEDKKEEGKKEEGKNKAALLNTFAEGTLSGINIEEADLANVVFQGKFEGAFERTDEGEYYFQGTITNINFFTSGFFQAAKEMPELETFNGFFKGHFVNKDKAPHQAVDPQIQRKQAKKEYHVPVMVRMELRKISKINLLNSSAEIAAVLHIAIRLNEEALGKIYNKEKKQFVKKRKLCIDFHMGKPLLMPFYNLKDLKDESDTDNETLYEWDDIWEGIDYNVEWEPEEMVLRYRIQMNYKAEIDNSHGIFWAPFNLTVLKIIVDFHSLDADGHKICFNCCDLTDFDEAAPYSPYTQFSDLPLLPDSKHIDRLTKFNTFIFLDQGEYMLATNRLALFPYHKRIFKNKNSISSDYAWIFGLSQRSKLLAEPEVKSIKESQEHFNQHERHLIFSLERWEFVHIEIPIFKYPAIDLIRIFVPIIILSAISITIFLQENAVDSGGFTELSKRIASSCSLMIAYIALIPLIRKNLPPTPSVTLVEILIYISTIPNFLAIISVLTTSFVDYQDFFDNYRPWIDPLFRASFVICVFSIFTLLIVMIVYARKNYKTTFNFHKLKTSPLENLRSPVCLKYFDRVKEIRKEFSIEQIPFGPQKEVSKT